MAHPLLAKWHFEFQRILNSLRLWQSLVFNSSSTEQRSEAGTVWLKQIARPVFHSIERVTVADANDVMCYIESTDFIFGYI